MAKGGAAGGNQREGNALKTAVVVTGGLVLAWLTMETAFKPFLDRLRAAISRSTDPSRDPDEDTARPPAAEDKSSSAAAAAAAAAEPSAPPPPAEEEEGEDKKKGKEKDVELKEEKEEAAAAAKAE